jgi:hypothetical protein
MVKYWHGKVEDIDDMGVPIEDTFIDGATIYGPWAIMAPGSHKIIGRGLGNGRGQKYERQSDGRWLKVE